jgi:hypothetical protein
MPTSDREQGRHIHYHHIGNTNADRKPPPSRLTALRFPEPKQALFIPITAVPDWAHLLRLPVAGDTSEWRMTPEVFAALPKYALCHWCPNELGPAWLTPLAGNGGKLLNHGFVDLETAKTFLTLHLESEHNVRGIDSELFLPYGDVVIIDPRTPNGRRKDQNDPQSLVFLYSSLVGNDSIDFLETARK